ncbi:hypothetical protein EYF80_017724 [Liparis tanakae]|uniref:Uncharacterized protein n=1 Tax=Liparis tanakae TaxID=230148 RepID=A0A4Z2I1J8_9TELE|nr:hypothetical protein EYF80_017724 [Liparis tanakae]
MCAATEERRDGGVWRRRGILSSGATASLLNGPPMSVKKEREAELLVNRREQRSGERYMFG